MLLETDPPLSDAFLRDITVNFLLAGRDTTAQTLLWNTFFVSQSPGVEARLLQELKELGVVDVPADAELLNRMAYHKQVLNETLRVIPPVPLEGREALADDVLPNGVFVPKGWIVAYMGPMYHRNKELWGADADLYDPDRWSADRKASVCCWVARALNAAAQDAIRPYQFLAFHGGEQRCLGQVMAYQELKVSSSWSLSLLCFTLCAGCVGSIDAALLVRARHAARRRGGHAWPHGCGALRAVVSRASTQRCAAGLTAGPRGRPV